MEQGITPITFTVLLENEGLDRKYQKKVHVNTDSDDEKDEFKKSLIRYLWVYDTKKERVFDNIIGRVLSLL
ncbi:MAG: hypothetical protein L0H53_14765 [Candidatus Nitrosocosmicus sp.]|nr:hypothetical protein [Candidatus Nitrosocosmicus sp.]MDN5867872.1 hypothetical protein [Candidatus Nitrosocosmicus sp.]